jgi:hypothetical protein
MTYFVLDLMAPAISELFGIPADTFLLIFFLLITSQFEWHTANLEIRSCTGVKQSFHVLKCLVL